MTSQKRDSHRDSDKHWPCLLEVARTLYGSAQFAISSARRFSFFRGVPISKFEERPGEYNVEQIKTLPVNRDSNTLKHGEFVYYKTKLVLEFLGIYKQTPNVSGNFFEYPEN